MKLIIYKRKGAPWKPYMHRMQIFMGKFESIFIYTYINNQTLPYFQYIFDLFFIWEGTEEELPAFFETIDNANKTIKFEFKYCYEKNEFLTCKVYKNKDGKLCLDFTGTYRWQNVLYFNSVYLFVFKEVLLIPKHSLWKNVALKTHKNKRSGKIKRCVFETWIRRKTSKDTI